MYAIPMNIQRALMAAMLSFALMLGVFIFMLGGATMIFSPLGGKTFFLEGMLLPYISIIIILAVSAVIILRVLAGRHLQVKTEKESYAPDEKISGTITIGRDINKQARSLTVSFYGLERRGKRFRKVCVKETVLSGARTFRKGETVPFTISIPPEVKTRIGSKQGVGFSINGLPLFAPSYVTGWYVGAKIDLPGEVDMVNEAMVQIVEKSEAKGEKPSAGNGGEASGQL